MLQEAVCRAFHVVCGPSPLPCSVSCATCKKDGWSKPTGVSCSGALLLRLLDAYAVRYGEMLDGRSEQLPTSELAGGARIRHIFQDIFVEGVGQLNPSRYIRPYYGV